MIEHRKHTPGEIMRDCITTLGILSLLGALFAGLALEGLAGMIEAVGDAVRWVL